MAFFSALAEYSKYNPSQIIKSANSGSNIFQNVKMLLQGTQNKTDLLLQKIIAQKEYQMFQEWNRKPWNKIDRIPEHVIDYMMKAPSEQIIYIENSPPLKMNEFISKNLALLQQNQEQQQDDDHGQ